MSNVRAKFSCTEVAKMKSGADTLERVRLAPVCGGSDENRTWSKYTPAGSLEMTITAAGAQGFFEPGVEYYIDITPATA